MDQSVYQRARILVVDDVDINRLIVRGILEEDYDVEDAENGVAALEILRNSGRRPDLILLDIMMPEMDGFEVMEHIKADPVLKSIPVIFITAADEETRALEQGAVDYISKPFVPRNVKLRVNTQVELALYRDRLESLVEQKANELVATKENILETMASLIEYRSLESGEHVRRTRTISQMIVNQLMTRDKHKQYFYDNDYISLIKAVTLHDIGKIGIPDQIMLKPGRLTPDEFAVMKTHANIGGDIMRSLMQVSDDLYFRHCYDISRGHHEWWDGSGYPNGWKGEEIPISARIAAISDVYDALVSVRVYKPAYTHEEASKIINSDSGTHFDPDVVEAFNEVSDKIVALYDE